MINGFCFRTLFLGFVTAVGSASAMSTEPDPDYYYEGDLAGSLKTEGPLAVYHPDPQHVWNRLFSAFYIRTSNIPAKPDGKPIQRIEGGDYIDFFAWSRTEYWSSAETAKRLNHLLDEFLNAGKTQMVDEPQKRVVLLRDPAMCRLSHDTSRWSSGSPQHAIHCPHGRIQRRGTTWNRASTRPEARRSPRPSCGPLEVTARNIPTTA